MSVYKVPQDVEAEDKFLGPLSFKQFLFFGGAAICGYIVFITFTKGLWYIGAVFALPAAGFGILAFPWSKEQPSDLWLAAHIRFFFVKRKRIWDQSGMKDFVTITAPKREAHALTDGLTQDEVRTRFNALASVVDSRGWAIKNLPGGAVTHEEDDRLVQASYITPPQDTVEAVEPVVAIDEDDNLLAKQFDTMIDESKNKHHRETLAMIQEARQQSEGEAPVVGTPLPTVVAKPAVAGSEPAAEDLWFLKDNPQPVEPGFATFKDQPVVGPGPKSTSPAMGMGVPVDSTDTVGGDDEQQLLEKIHERKRREAALEQHSHLKTLQPMSVTPTVPFDEPNDETEASSTTPVDPAIINLANNNDLNVETLSRQANKGSLDDNEVIVTLH